MGGFCKECGKVIDDKIEKEIEELGKETNWF